MELWRKWKMNLKAVSAPRPAKSEEAQYRLLPSLLVPIFTWDTSSHCLSSALPTLHLCSLCTANPSRRAEEHMPPQPPKSARTHYLALGCSPSLRKHSRDLDFGLVS